MVLKFGFNKLRNISGNFLYKNEPRAAKFPERGGTRCFPFSCQGNYITSVHLIVRAAGAWNQRKRWLGVPWFSPMTKMPNFSRANPLFRGERWSMGLATLVWIYTACDLYEWLAWWMFLATKSSRIRRSSLPGKMEFTYPNASPIL